MITKCICYNKTFGEILHLSHTKNIKTLIEIQEKLKICNKCKRCNPYIEQTLQTGKHEYKL